MFSDGPQSEKEVSRFGVPQIQSAEEFVAKLRGGIKPIHEINFNGTLIPSRVISIDELLEIKNESKLEALKMKGDKIDQDVITQKLTLARATAVPKDSIPVLNGAVLSQLSADEIHYLYNEYMNILDRFDPAAKTLTEEELNFIKDTVKKNPLTPNNFSLRQLKGICLDWLNLQTLPKDS